MMTKQTIEIDVPDGYEVAGWSQGRQYYVTDGSVIDVIVRLKNKEPEFIEIRSYLYRNSDGIKGSVLFKHNNPSIHSIQNSYGFIRWLDEDWRKIYL